MLAVWSEIFKRIYFPNWKGVYVLINTKLICLLIIECSMFTAPLYVNANGPTTIMYKLIGTFIALIN
jgi:hypothetical protein